MDPDIGDIRVRWRKAPPCHINPETAAPVPTSLESDFAILIEGGGPGGLVSPVSDEKRLLRTEYLCDAENS